VREAHWYHAGGHPRPTAWCARGQRPRNAALGASTGLSGVAPRRGPRRQAPGATDGARPAPEVIAGAAEACPPARKGQLGAPPSASRGAESGHAAHYMLSLCAGAPGGGKGPQMAFLAAWPPHAAQRHSHRPHGTAP
jgi:hypothetical protein